jgi:hypothetical protein
MQSLDRFVLKSMLRIEQPWAVQAYRFDARRNRLDVTVGIEMPRAWFGFSRAAAPGDTEIHQWRHVNLAGWHTHLRVSVPPGMRLPRAAWCGDADHPFTSGLAQRVFVLFNEGLTLRSVCAVLEIPLDEVWKYRYLLDSGKAGSDGAQMRPAASPAAMPDSVSAAAKQALAEEVIRHEGLPDPSDPVWQGLIEGQFDIDIRLLGLKLLLAKVRSQLDVIRDEQVRMLKLGEIYRYFARNVRALDHEIEQLRRRAQQS